MNFVKNFCGRLKFKKNYPVGQLIFSPTRTLNHRIKLIFKKSAFQKLHTARILECVLMLNSYKLGFA